MQVEQEVCDLTDIMSSESSRPAYISITSLLVLLLHALSSSLQSLMRVCKQIVKVFDSWLSFYSHYSLDKAWTRRPWPGTEESQLQKKWNKRQISSFALGDGGSRPWRCCDQCVSPGLMNRGRKRLSGGRKTNSYRNNSSLHFHSILQLRFRRSWKKH